MSKRILVIDDEGGVRKVIQISLEAAAGWEVVTAASGAEGLLKAQQETFDAILLDVMMPELDGLATFDQLKSHETTQHTPMILLTAKTSQYEHQQFIQRGVMGVITKPFRARHLVAQIQTILNWVS
ncbi:MAG: response regulator [Oscillatoriophycideae cyanobacterium NC_groundwater_1537_Pr4_S-0.65um_50_18]|nr:response regulator [Oscillatoriophycideae cyanobacterium NC_groundwater_1537_Pr4_S-0.65um_50_18]